MCLHYTIGEDSKKLKKFFREFIESEFQEGYIICSLIEITFNLFLSYFKIVDAAGGVVKNEKGEMLFIFRKKLWDLPKGHVDEGESYYNAALREVSEETGIPNPEIKAELIFMHHMYKENRKWCIKRVLWYEMFCSSKTPLIPQAEEKITNIKWFHPQATKEVFLNSFASIKEITKLYI